MKRTLSSLLLALALLAAGVAASQLMAQTGAVPVIATAQPAQQRAAIPVAVVDFALLMEIHPQLHAHMAQLEEYAKKKDIEIQQEYIKLQADEKALVGIQPGTVEFTNKQNELRLALSEWQIKRDTIGQDVQRREILMTYSAYTDIKAMVEVFASGNNISVVINHLDIAKRLPDLKPGEEPSLQVKNSHLSRIPLVVYHSQGFDITPYVEDMLVKKYVDTRLFPRVDYAELKKKAFGMQPGGGGVAPVNPGVAVQGQPVPR